MKKVLLSYLLGCATSQHLSQPYLAKVKGLYFHACFCFREATLREMRTRASLFSLGHPLLIMTFALFHKQKWYKKRQHLWEEQNRTQGCHTRARSLHYAEHGACPWLAL